MYLLLVVETKMTLQILNDFLDCSFSKMSNFVKEKVFRRQASKAKNVLGFEFFNIGWHHSQNGPKGPNFVKKIEYYF